MSADTSAPERATRSLRCAIGWHDWRRATFDNQTYPTGRRCKRCGRVQFFRPTLFGSDWIDTGMQPREDAHGYY